MLPFFTPFVMHPHYCGSAPARCRSELRFSPGAWVLDDPGQSPLLQGGRHHDGDSAPHEVYQHSVGLVEPEVRHPIVGAYQVATLKVGVQLGDGLAIGLIQSSSGNGCGGHILLLSSTL